MTQSVQSDEAKIWAENKALYGNERMTLGPFFTWQMRNTPRRIMNMFSYYKFMAKMIGPGKRVLEVGCNEAMGAHVVAEFATDYLGIDLDEAGIAVAREQMGSEKIRFAVADVIKDRMGTFDAAVSQHVIEHVYQEHEDQFLEGIKAHLTDAGICIISTPNLPSDQFSSPATRLGHVNVFSYERLLALMQKHFQHVFMFSANDEIVHTGFAPMAFSLIALCVNPRRNTA